jgi:hypothetical protein
MRGFPHPCCHSAPQLRMSFLVAHRKKVVSGGIESHDVVPWSTCVWRSHGHHSAKYIGIASDQVIGTDSCQRACAYQSSSLQLGDLLQELTVFVCDLLQ